METQHTGTTPKARAMYAMDLSFSFKPKGPRKRHHTWMHMKGSALLSSLLAINSFLAPLFSLMLLCLCSASNHWTTPFIRTLGMRYRHGKRKAPLNNTFQVQGRGNSWKNQVNTVQKLLRRNMANCVQLFMVEMEVRLALKASGCCPDRAFNHHSS